RYSKVYHMGVHPKPRGRWILAAILAQIPPALIAQSLNAPGGVRQAQRGTNASILPGGRIIQPKGVQFLTGPGPFGLAVNALGSTILTANTGPGQNSLTILTRDRAGKWLLNRWAARTHDQDDDEASGQAGWRGVFMGIALAGEHTAFVSEGNSGRV